MLRGNETIVEPLCGDDLDKPVVATWAVPPQKHFQQPLHRNAHLPPLLIALIAYVYAEAVMGSPSALALSKAVAAWRHIRNDAKSARRIVSGAGWGR